MYNDEIRQATIDSLESKIMNLVNTSIVLASQGYLVNKAKKVKLEWASILIDAFENINVLDKEQQNNIERIYNKISEYE